MDIENGISLDLELDVTSNIDDLLRLVSEYNSIKNQFIAFNLTASNSNDYKSIAERFESAEKAVNDFVLITGIDSRNPKLSQLMKKNPDQPLTANQ